MYYGGRPEPLHPVAAALHVAVGAAAGATVGYVAFLLATWFPHLLQLALPAMTQRWFLALWAAAMLIPAGAFLAVLRGGRGAGTKAYAAAGLLALAASFAIDATGLHRMFPHETAWYVAPPQPDPPSNARY